MDRYSLINDHLKRELLLLQGLGGVWRKCTFCDYHTDLSGDPFEVNRAVLEQVTGVYGVLDVINSGSGMELDSQTIAELKRVVEDKQIHTLWFEMHYMYRSRLDAFAKQFPFVKVKFRCGIETFDPVLRQKWNKGVATTVQPQDVARYFQGVCLLCGTQGETKERILKDIAEAKKYFEYFSINLFCNNSTAIKRDELLVSWFKEEVYPLIKDEPGIEILFNNVDLGVG